MRFDCINALLTPGYLKMESGVVDYDDGFKTVCAFTRMPRCKAKMVQWWFGGAAICARIGSLEAPINLGRMTHFVRNTDAGCEMRSRFFLGHVESRDANQPFSQEQAAAVRSKKVTDDLAKRLHHHATEEMGYLADLLPVM